MSKEKRAKQLLDETYPGLTNAQITEIQRRRLATEIAQRRINRAIERIAERGLQKMEELRRRGLVQ
jgi:hypothetical protein